MVVITIGAWPCGWPSSTTVAPNTFLSASARTSIFGGSSFLTSGTNSSWVLRTLATLNGRVAGLVAGRLDDDRVVAVVELALPRRHADRRARLVVDVDRRALRRRVDLHRVTCPVLLPGQFACACAVLENTATRAATSATRAIRHADEQSSSGPSMDGRCSLPAVVTSRAAACAFSHHGTRCTT